MNARVDPAALAAPPAGDDDAKLVAICRAAIRAIDVDIDAEELVRATEAQCMRERPPYPGTDWVFSGGGEHTSRKLRRELKKYGPAQTLAWRSTMKKQITAVSAWERACKAVEKKRGLDKAIRTYDRAMALAKKYVGDVSAITAATVKGAAWKSTVSARWITAG